MTFSSDRSSVCAEVYRILAHYIATHTMLTRNMTEAVLSVELHESAVLGHTLLPTYSPEKCCFSQLLEDLPIVYDVCSF